MHTATNLSYNRAHRVLKRLGRADKIERTENKNILNIGNETG